MRVLLRETALATRSAFSLGFLHPKLVILIVTHLPINSSIRYNCFMRGIHYVTDLDLVWVRHPNGQKFKYTTKSGEPLSAAHVSRIEALVIPPAWTDVHISPDTAGHIQAVGLDSKGRKQYIYHPNWVQYNQEQKFDQMVQFGQTLPTLRRTISSHMHERTLTRARVIATVVWLLEHTFIRVGNEAYAKENQSYGLTTMRERHVEVDGNTITFSFKGKSGVFHELDVTHPRVARTIRACIELPGYQIFQYIDEDKARQVVDSKDVNDYLREITGEEFSAKSFRTWGGSTLAADSLYRMGSPETKTETKQNLVQAVKAVSKELGNTVSVCRKYYIHPVIIESHQKNILVPRFDKIYRKSRHIPFGLSREETATWTLIKAV